jgi:hypothetical protein
MLPSSAYAVRFSQPFVSSFWTRAFVAMNRWGSAAIGRYGGSDFTSNALAGLTIAPLIVTWCHGWDGDVGKNVPRQSDRSISLLISLLLVSFILFTGISADFESALLYVPLPFSWGCGPVWNSRRYRRQCGRGVFLAIWGFCTRARVLLPTTRPEENAPLCAALLIFYVGAGCYSIAALIEERSRTEGVFAENVMQRIRLAAGISETRRPWDDKLQKSAKSWHE